MPEDQKRVSDSLELKLQIVNCLGWEFNPYPLGEKKASLKTTRKVTNLRRADAFRRYFVVLGLGIAGVWIRGLELGLIWVFALS